METEFPVYSQDAPKRVVSITSKPTLVADIEAPDDLSFDPLDALHENGQRGSIFSEALSREKTSLEWSDLRYSVTTGKGENKKTKEILKGMSGYARPGSVLAIMGASGAGKTTLLNMLAGRLSQAGNGKTSGTITLNGTKRRYDNFRRISAYVLQQDNFFAELTVKETITLSALLRLPRAMPEAEKLKRVADVIMELGLVKCQDTLVGNELIRGVSGGERKRVNIGTELVTDPSLIFLDEPSTGLDSFNAQNVMSTLLTLARANRTIVATIHQPRSSIYQMFDNLMLLSEGNTIYFGPASDATAYFANIGYKCPESFNPSDYFLDLISLDQRSPDKQRQTLKRIEHLSTKYKEHLKTAPLALTSAEDAKDASSAVAKAVPFEVSWLTQFWLLTQRSLRVMSREKANNFAQLGQTIVFAILLGCIWLREGTNLGASSVQSIAGGLFFILVNQSFGGVFGIIFLFPAERVIVLKERASRSYQTGAYFWSKTMAELPRTAVFTLLFSVIAYFMVDLRSGADRFFTFFLILLLTTMSSEGIAYCVSALAADPQQAGALAPVFIVTSMLFGGFFIGTDTIPVWLSWLKWLSFLKYGFGAAMNNEFADRPFDTTSCANSTETPFCPANGDQVLEFYQSNDLTLWENVGVLVGFVFILRFIAYYILRSRGPKYDKSI